MRDENEEGGIMGRDWGLFHGLGWGCTMAGSCEGTLTGIHGGLREMLAI
jgi:hypothetical protein